MVTTSLPISQAAYPHVVRVPANKFGNAFRELTTNKQETRQIPKLQDRK